MKNSIEEIWKEGFLNEKSLIAPKINDLYNQKSKHLVDKVKRRFRLNLIIIFIMAIVMPVIFYFIDALWYGIATTVLMLLVAWYNIRLVKGMKTLDQGANSLDYLRSFNQWLKDILAGSEKLVRFYYPLCFLISVGTVWSAWEKQGKPAFIFVGNVSLFALIIVGVITVLMCWFSDKIYKWEVRLMYGDVFSKLEGTIAEMEELKQG